MTSLLRYWFPFLLYSGCILFLSTQPLSGLPRLPISDKVVHFFEYGLYGALLIRLLVRQFNRPLIQGALLAWLGVAIFGLLDEMIQSFTMGRHAEFLDWLADMCGGLFGIASYLIIRHIFDRMRQQI